MKYFDSIFIITFTDIILQYLHTFVNKNFIFSEKTETNFFVFLLDIDTVLWFIINVKGEMQVEYLTIGQVSKKFDVTPRMLRYYEKLGLIEATRKEDNAYRVYDENSVKRLRRIIILRKLRIPLKQIDIILRENQQRQAQLIFQRSIEELDGEIDSLGKIRGILKSFSERLDICVEGNRRFDLLEDSELWETADKLSLSKNVFKESSGED